MAKETAEQKLLKLIEAEEGSSGKPDVARHVAQAVKGKSLEEVPLPGFVRSIPDFFKSFASPHFSGSVFNLKHINTLLTLMILAVLVVLGLSITRGVHTLAEGITFDVDIEPARTVQSAVAVIPGVEAHLANISSRNIFAPVEKKVAESAAVFSDETRQISARTRDFRLVGISWLNAPETATAMIEDQKTFVTHFLKQGEDLNGVTIEAIYADRVILSYAGEKLILKL